ncbi:DUF2786 domain-containing protein [Insolitispirillum peregrinum]
MSDTDRMVAKIKKLLALSASPNEAEAAAALSKAKELMEKHSISDTAIRLADITEAKGKASVADRPNRWESDLVDLVARAFGCKTLFASGEYEPRGYGYRRANSTRTDTIKPDDHRAFDAGYAAGANVRLDQAVAANARPEMIGRFDA